jgi:hypothetical protein
MTTMHVASLDKQFAWKCDLEIGEILDLLYDQILENVCGRVVWDRIEDQPFSYKLIVIEA